jgi:predicted nucleotide-binding protein
VGSTKGAKDSLRPRARQNVVMELGYFMGVLGRGKVCVMHRGNLERPSDVHGVVYIELDDHEGWRAKLARELKAAGLDVNLSGLA